MTGTFTDLAYNREGGDVMGTEIRIVAGRHGLQATVQVAEGSPSDLVLIPTVRVGQGEKLRFDLPPNDLDLRSFDGVVTITSCTRETDPASKADFIGPFIRKAIGTGVFRYLDGAFDSARVADVVQIAGDPTRCRE